MASIRVDKYLASMSYGSRKEVKKMLRQGRVRCNDSNKLTPEYKVDTDKDRVYVDDKLVEYKEYEYYMLYKPVGYVSVTRDAHNPTVMELMKGCKRKDLFPAGRLDKDVEGLLFITNDGKLASRLLSPKHHVEKTYYVRVQGKLTEEDISYLRQGVDIGDDTPTRPAKVELLAATEQSEVKLIITEGRYHQVKRMFAAIGKPVLYLKRIAMGKVNLPEDLQPGEYRRLTEEELQALS